MAYLTSSTTYSDIQTAFASKYCRKQPPKQHKVVKTNNQPPPFGLRPVPQDQNLAIFGPSLSATGISTLLSQRCLQDRQRLDGLLFGKNHRAGPRRREIR